MNKAQTCQYVVSRGLGYIHDKVNQAENDRELRYKTAIAYPMLTELSGVRQPSFSNVQTLALDKY
jgi:hypothetical protein